jgi:hypothetical protein
MSCLSLQHPAPVSPVHSKRGTMCFQLLQILPPLTLTDGAL